MTPQDRIAQMIADYLAAGRSHDARRAVAMMLGWLDLSAEEVRMWGFGIPAEDGA